MRSIQHGALFRSDPNVQTNQRNPTLMFTSVWMSKSSTLLALLFLGFLCQGVVGQSVIQFDSKTYTVSEGSESLRLHVLRSGGLDRAAQVSFKTVDGTGIAGSSYTAATGTLSFEPGETTKIISIGILNDGLAQSAKNFSVLLSDPTDGATLGVLGKATVTIADNDVGIQFQFATYSVVEDAGDLEVRIVRGDDGNLPVSVRLTSSDLTAKSGLDYVGFTNTIDFAAQERTKSIFIHILNNTNKQALRGFRLTLDNPSGMTLGIQKTATVAIKDNDQGIQFALPNITVQEDEGIAWIEIMRGSDFTDNALSVDLSTGDISAIDGMDYVGVTNTVSLAAGERSKVIGIQILNDGVKEARKAFRVKLSHPSDGAVLGSVVTSSVSIEDNDPGVGFTDGEYGVRETVGSVTLTVLRGNDVDLSPFHVHFQTSDLSAKAGTDYEAVSGELVFEQNRMVQTIRVPIHRNLDSTNDSSFRIKLSNPSDNAKLGNAAAIVHILKTVGNGTYRWVAPPFETSLGIQENGGHPELHWNGGGTLQRADFPDGPWQMLSNAVSPYRVGGTLPTAFYRVTSPRPAELYVPSSYDGHTELPLVLLLHGYGGSGADIENYFKLQPLAESRGFHYCYPNGTLDQWNYPFWDATDIVGGYASETIDDVGYLRALIEEIARNVKVDRKRIYLVGHSNGGFMSYRMACEASDLVAAIASLAGMTYLDLDRCHPEHPVNILHIHGTEDAVVSYGGGAVTSANPVFSFAWNSPAFPGALKTIENWAFYNGANDLVTDTEPSLDLTVDVPGPETLVTRYKISRIGGSVELWTVVGGTHGPSFSDSFAPNVIDWLLAHPKP